jgi:hypothetical protein
MVPVLNAIGTDVACVGVSTISQTMEPKNYIEVWDL